MKKRGRIYTKGGGRRTPVIYGPKPREWYERVPEPKLTVDPYQSTGDAGITVLRNLFRGDRSA